MKNRARRVLTITVGSMLLLACAFSQNTTYHVYSEEIPWIDSNVVKDAGKTYSINEAIGLASAGDSIVIHQGIYREKITVDKNNLIFQNFEDDYVIITGADLVSGWVQATDMAAGIMMADISGLDIETDYTQMFTNGVKQTMARHPNNKTGKMMEPMDANSGFAPLTNVYKDAGTNANGHVTLNGEPLPDVDLTGGIVRAMTGKMRNYVYGDITASSGNSVTFKAINNGIWKNDAAIQNTQFKFSWGFVMHKNLIDYPGEWYADDSKLYYMPPEDVSLDTMRTEIQVRERVLVLNNTTGVTLKGLNFVAGNADMQSTNDAIIEGCSFRNLYPFWTPTSYGQSSTNSKGIYLENSSNNLFKNTYVAHSWGNMFAMKGGDNNSFQNCVIKDFGWVGVFTSGIYIRGCNTNINNCTFGDAGRFQIRIDGENAKVNILDCDFYGSMKMGEDAGPIESTSTGKIGALDLLGSEIAYNKIHDVQGVPVSDGGYARVKATAFYMEDVQNYTAHHNLVYNLQHTLYNGPHEIERHGEFLYLGPRYNAMHLPVNYYNNTVWNVDQCIGIWNIVIANWEELGITPLSDTTGLIENGHFANNIFYGGAEYKLSYSAQEISSTGAKIAWAQAPEGSSIETSNFNQYTAHCANWGYNFNPENNVILNPNAGTSEFTNPSEGDYSLKSGSSAVGAGIPIEGITSSDTPDCGAFEGGDRVLHAGATISEPDFLERNPFQEQFTGLVNRPLNAFKFNAYPNPAISQVFFQSDLGNTQTLVSVYSLSGKKLISRKHNLYEAFDVSTLERGMYIISVQSEKRSSTQKLLINK